MPVFWRWMLSWSKLHPAVTSFGSLSGYKQAVCGCILFISHEHCTIWYFFMTWKCWTRNILLLSLRMQTGRLRMHFVQFGHFSWTVYNGDTSSWDGNVELRNSVFKLFNLYTCMKSGVDEIWDAVFHQIESHSITVPAMQSRSHAAQGQSTNHIEE